ncbi:uncharacterized protein LOC134060318 [Sardina pilchardus]|uniref:uncharacterized protein LOC134060318 n=1 Tax=Sardina pilchardus TaxID=27697 RepID=UPI002E140F62
MQIKLNGLLQVFWTRKSKDLTAHMASDIIKTSQKGIVHVLTGDQPTGNHFHCHLLPEIFRIDLAIKICWWFLNTAHFEGNYSHAILFASRICGPSPRSQDGIRMTHTQMCNCGHTALQMSSKPAEPFDLMGSVCQPFFPVPLQRSQQPGGPEVVTTQESGVPTSTAALCRSRHLSLLSCPNHFSTTISWRTSSERAGYLTVAGGQ